MSICFLSSHHIYLGTWVCRYFVPILTKYHFIREAKCNGFSNKYPNQTFITTWRQPTVRKLECWTQVICGCIGIIEETRIWEMSENHHLLFLIIVMTINILPALFIWYYCRSSCKILANSVQWSVCTDICMSAIIYYWFILSLWPHFNVTINVRYFQLTSL